MAAPSLTQSSSDQRPRASLPSAAWELVVWQPLPSEAQAAPWTGVWGQGTGPGGSGFSKDSDTTQHLSMKDGTDTVLHVEFAEPSQVRTTESRSSKPQLPTLAGSAPGQPCQAVPPPALSPPPLSSRLNSATLPLSPSRGHLALHSPFRGMPPVTRMLPVTVAISGMTRGKTESPGG